MRQVPPCLVDEEHGVRTWRNGLSNLRQMQVHRKREPICMLDVYGDGL